MYYKFNLYYTLIKFAEASFDEDAFKKINFEFVQFFQEPSLFINFFALEILWDELMSDSSDIGHLLSSRVAKLAEVISNGGGVAHQFHTDSVHNYSVR